MWEVGDGKIMWEVGDWGRKNVGYVIRGCFM